MISAIENLTILSPPKGFEIIFATLLILLLIGLSKLFTRIIRCDTMFDYIVNNMSVIVFMIILFFISANVISHFLHGVMSMIR